ncbi:MAG: AMP-binding protein [Rhodospirillales bacterium]|nr:AMP-binding protein [Rhodospirillales bacterium]
MANTIFDTDLDRNAANFVALSPISFLVRSARVWPGRTAVVHGARRFTYAMMLERCRRFAAALAARGIGRGDTVAVLAPNTPAMLEAHYAIPMAGGVICAINTRLDAATVAFILDHSEARALLVDQELAPLAAAALALARNKPLVIDIADEAAPPNPPIGAIEYEALLASGDPAHPMHLPDDEWQAISLGYTSGTTGDPKGVVCHHRGAHLNAVANVLGLGLTPESVYLWTLPMFHCNGWTYTWGVTLAGGTHVCLRRVDPALIFALIEQEAVTHLCAAPVVMTMLIHAPADVRRRPPRKVRIATGGAAPPTAVIGGMEALGFEVMHLYGLTEVYGPATFCAWQPTVAQMSTEMRARFTSRQGVPSHMLEDATVMDADGHSVPADATTMGELMLRGNTVMKGYLKNPEATRKAFAGGWFHTGDLGVLHPDGYIEIRDRSKDIIISGGENISSLEIEQVLFRHPAIMEAAVVAQPDARWGEVPHAFVTAKPGHEESLTPDDVIAFCRQHLAGYKVPKHITFGALPKTSTGKIQKFELRRRVAG